MNPSTKKSGLNPARSARASASSALAPARSAVSSGRRVAPAPARRSKSSGSGPRAPARRRRLAIGSPPGSPGRRSGRRAPAPCPPALVDPHRGQPDRRLDPQDVAVAGAGHLLGQLVLRRPACSPASGCLGRRSARSHAPAGSPRRSARPRTRRRRARMRVCASRARQPCSAASWRKSDLAEGVERLDDGEVRPGTPPTGRENRKSLYCFCDRLHRGAGDQRARCSAGPTPAVSETIGHRAARTWRCCARSAASSARAAAICGFCASASRNGASRSSVRATRARRLPRRSRGPAPREGEHRAVVLFMGCSFPASSAAPRRPLVAPCVGPRVPKAYLPIRSATLTPARCG